MKTGQFGASPVPGSLVRSDGTVVAGTTLALGRNLAPYVIAADVAGLDVALDRPLADDLATFGDDCFVEVYGFCELGSHC